MPSIPKAERQVQRTALRGVTQQGASQEAFGASVGTAIKSTGEAVSKQVFDQLAVQNETKAKELDVEFSQSLRAMQFDPKEGYYNKRGKDAYDYQPVFQQATVELSKQFMDRAENDSQREMLGKVMQQRVTRAQDGVTRHAFKEYNAWVDNAAAARVDDSLQESIANYNNTDYIKQLRQSSRNEIITTGQRQGKGQEAINVDLKNYDSKMHEGIIERVILDDPKAAREYFDNNKDEINGDKQAGLLRKLKVAEKGDLATDREHYSQISKMAAFDPDKFINMDLAEFDLSDADFKKFKGQQVTAKRSKDKHDEKYSGIKRSMTLANNTLKSAGIKTSGKLNKRQAKLLNTFQGALLMEIEHFNKQNGRAPDDKEQLNMIGNLLRRGEVAGTGIIFEDEAFLFEGKPNTLIDIGDIEVTEQSKIRAAYQRKLGREPTSKEIERAYTRRVLKNTSTGEQ